MIRKHTLPLVLCLVVEMVVLGFIFRPRPPEQSVKVPKSPIIIADERARELLASADTVRVEVEFVECFSSEGPSCGAGRTFVMSLEPKEVRPLINQLKLTTAESSEWGTGYMPALCFDFYRYGYKEGKQIGSVYIGYGNLTYNYFFAPATVLYPGAQRDTLIRGLHPDTVRLFRQLVTHHPEMEKALKEGGGVRVLQPG